MSLNLGLLRRHRILHDSYLCSRGDVEAIIIMSTAISPKSVKRLLESLSTNSDKNPSLHNQGTEAKMKFNSNKPSR